VRVISGGGKREVRSGREIFSLPIFPFPHFPTSHSRAEREVGVAGHRKGDGRW
jgi:hypothetical protein